MFIKKVFRKALILVVCFGIHLPLLSLTSDQSFYPSPGIVGLIENEWVGSDHLLNVSGSIGVAVEILAPEGAEIDVTEQMLKSRIEEAFLKANIKTTAESGENEPPLPFFHMLIMIYPIEKGYVAYCDGRLFEEIKTERIELPVNTILQAIIWERQNLIIIPANGLLDQIGKSVDEITTAFIERYQFFDRLE